MRDVNSVTLVGRLTRDVELRALPSGTDVCTLRLAFSTSKKNPHTGDFEDKSNYIDVTIFGRQAASAARYLSKGRPVAVQGRLEWREWQDKDGGKRQSIEVVADHVQFLSDGQQREQSFSQTGGGDIPSDPGFGVPTSGGESFGVPPSGGRPMDDDDSIPF